MARDEVGRARALLALVGAASLGVGAWGVGAAAAASGDCVTSGPTVTCTYTPTGAAQTFTVPSGVTSIDVVALGAPGGTGGPGSVSGRGARVTGTLAVTPGSVLGVRVGGLPTNAAACAAGIPCVGGFNGGGSSTLGGGGGGASDIRQGGTALADRVLVAAGGAGAGANGICGEGIGGYGGDAGGFGGTGGPCDNFTGGNGGNLGQAGQGGEGGPLGGADGGLGVGGAGGGTPKTGGAGGGGRYGGGGGGEGTDLGHDRPGGGGGGGGSSLVPSGGTSSIDTTRTPGIVLTYQAPPNGVPSADDDAYATDAGQTLVVGAPGVLGNDDDPDGEPVSAVLASGPSHGSLTLSDDGGFTYGPSSGFSGVDSFTYRAGDGRDTSAPATVRITVRAANRPPVANPDRYSVVAGQTLVVPIPGILDNDSDPDGNALVVSGNSFPAEADTFRLDETGYLEYTPRAGFTGTDSFTYRASDGPIDSDSNLATVTIDVLAAGQAPAIAMAGGRCVGQNAAQGAITFSLSDADTAASDITLTAESENAALVPQSGLTIAGAGASRTLTVRATAGQTGTAVVTLTAGDGVNRTTLPVTVRVGAGSNVTMVGGSGIDMLFGLGAKNTLDGRDGKDLICGGAGNDTLTGGSNGDVIYGYGGADVIKGASGLDQMTGGKGADKFDGGPDRDTITDLDRAEGDSVKNVP